MRIKLFVMLLTKVGADNAGLEIDGAKVNIFVTAEETTEVSTVIMF